MINQVRFGPIDILLALGKSTLIFPGDVSRARRLAEVASK